MTNNQSPARAAHALSCPTGAAGAPDDRSTIFDRALDACGWKDASRHFDAAVEASIARDDEAFNRELAAFRRISATWKSQQGAGDSANNAPGHIR